jgi:sugar phosphate permease
MVNVSLLLTSVIIFMISYAPVNDPVMLFLCATNGLVQSAAFPSCVSLVAIWFNKETLGSVIGLWSTSGSVGNMLGAFITSVLISYGLTWQASF